jgi:hypothetical protein
LSCAVYIPPNFEQDLLAERRPQIVAFYNEQYFMPGNITLAIWYLARPEPLLVQGEGRAPDRHRGPGHRKAGKAGGIARPGCGCRAAAEKAEGPALIVDACRSRRDTPSIVEPRGSIVVAGTAAIRRYLAVRPRSSEGPLSTHSRRSTL